MTEDNSTRIRELRSELIALRYFVSWLLGDYLKKERDGEDMLKELSDHFDKLLDADSPHSTPEGRATDEKTREEKDRIVRDVLAMLLEKDLPQGD